MTSALLVALRTHGAIQHLGTEVFNLPESEVLRRQGSDL